MAGEKLRVGIIGCGNRAQAHAAAVAAGDVMEVRRACDIIPEKAEQSATKWGAIPCTDYREVLADPEIDAVLIVTSVEAHLPIALDAVNAGKPLIVEKPIGDDPELAREFVIRGEKSGLPCYVSFQLRFQGMLEAVKGLAEKIDPVQILFERQRGMMKPQYLNPSPFCGIFDVVAHDFDQVLWLMGRPPRAVTAVPRCNTFTKNTGAADVLSAIVDFGDGRSAVVFSSIGAPEVGTRFDLIGSRGNYSFGSRQEPAGALFDPATPSGERTPATLPRISKTNPDVRLQRAFAEEIRNGTRSPLAARPRDGYYSLLTSLAAHRSGEEGLRVQLDFNLPESR